jgi:putative polyketide hydroxylase
VSLGSDRSTLDLFGRGFVLLRPAGDAPDGWAPAGVEAHAIDAQGFADAYGLADGGASLVRPDGVVGWRSRGPVDRAALEAALAAILARN